MLGRMLKKLTIFREAEIIHSVDFLKNGYSSRKLISYIRDHTPEQTITKSSTTAYRIVAKFPSKVILFPIHGEGIYQKFWLKAFDLEAFMHSSEQLFEVR